MKQPMATQVVLADHLVMFREAVHALLDRCGGYEIVASTENGRDALDAIRKHKPDLAIAETMLPGLSGFDLAQRVRQEKIDTRFIFLTQKDCAKSVEEAFEAGASGYVCKSDPSEELVNAIEAVRAGRTHVSPSVTGHLVKLAVGQRSSTDSTGLTAREREILQLVAEGMSSKEIAEVLHVSVRTVDTHRSNLMEKLGIHKVSGLVRYAIREGLMVP